MSFLETPLVPSSSGNRTGPNAKKSEAQRGKRDPSVEEEDGHTVSLDKMLLDESRVSIEMSSRR